MTHETILQPVHQLYIGEQKFPVMLTVNLVKDFKAIEEKTSGFDSIAELIQIFNCEINAEMYDVKFGLTLEEINKIYDLIKELK